MAKAKNVTLADIAAEVGVSNVAVSKALSGKPGVSEELRSKIKQISEQMGYLPGGPGRTGGTETGNIGVIIPEYYYGYSVSFYGKLHENVVRVLYDNKYYGILELLSGEDEEAKNLPKVLQDKKVDGLIFLGQINEEYVLEIIKHADVPFFFLDTYLPSARIDTVISDSYYGIYELTNYLIEQGHKKIGFVGNVDVTSSIADRFWGYRRALRENHIKFEEQWEIQDRDESGKTFEVILDSPNGMDAFVCNCDYTAYALIQDLTDAGYSVPEDVSVVGFDNYLPVGMDHKITTYAVDMEYMAKLCVRSLIRKIKHKKYVSGIQIVTGQVIHKQTVRTRK